MLCGLRGVPISYGELWWLLEEVTLDLSLEVSIVAARWRRRERDFRERELHMPISTGAGTVRVNTSFLGPEGSSGQWEGGLGVLRWVELRGNNEC